MLAKVHGRTVTLSPEEAERIQNNVTEEVLKSLCAVRTYIESLDNERQSKGTTAQAHGWWSGLDSNVSRLIEDLHAFYGMAIHTPPDRLRSAMVDGDA